MSDCILRFTHQLLAKKDSIKLSQTTIKGAECRYYRNTFFLERKQVFYFLYVRKGSDFS